MKNLTLTAAMLITMAVACSNTTKSTHDEVAIQRVDTMTVGVPQPALAAMARVGILPDSSDAALDIYRASRAYTYFEPQVQARFNKADSLAGVLTQLRDNYRRVFPERPFPAIYGIVSPYNRSIVTTSDTTLLLALNHYLGPDFEAYSVFEPYIRRQKSPDLIPYHIAEALVERAIPFEPVDSTLRERYTHDSIVAATVMRIVPNATIENVGGWTPLEVAWMDAHIDQMVSEIKDRELLDITDPRIIAQTINPAPATLSMGMNTPGRALRYLALRRVKLQ